eukprot:14077611-Alexandrium_andersonii.AAC.1
MSASLVGSEMCIRDRHVPAHQATAHLAGRKGLKAQRALRGLEDCIAPVSYTHLTLPTICSV